MIFENHKTPVMVFIEMVFAKYAQMNTHVPGFQSVFSFFASFCIGQIGHQQLEDIYIYIYIYLQIPSLGDITQKFNH